MALGDAVRVEMEIDAEPRTIEAPKDLQAAPKKNRGAPAAFEKLSYSKKKELVDWIEAAKQAQTRASRLEKTLELAKKGGK